MVSYTTCSKGEGLSEGNGRSEERIVESSGANEVDDLDGANMI